MVYVVAAVSLTAADDCSCPSEELSRTKIERALDERRLADAERLILSIDSASTQCRALRAKWFAALAVKRYDGKEAKAQSANITTGICRRLDASRELHAAQAQLLLNNYKESAELFLRSVSLATLPDHADLRVMSYVGLSAAYAEMAERHRAVEAARKALDVARQYPTDQSLGAAHNVLGSRLTQLSANDTNVSLVHEGNLHLDSSVPYLRKAGLYQFLANTYAIYVYRALQQGDTILALAWCDSILAFRETIAFASQRSQTFWFRHEIAMRQGRFPDAVREAENMILEADRAGFLLMQANARRCLAAALEKMGDYQRALHTQRDYERLHDSAVNMERLRTVTELEEKYDQTQNERTIEHQRTQAKLDNMRFWWIAAIAVVLLLALTFTVVLIRQRSLIARTRILEAEQKLHRARMNPHVLFNLITSLQAKALSENPASEMPRYLSSLATLMRSTLESTYLDTVTLHDEIENVQRMVELQRLRLDGEVKLDLHIDSDVDVTSLRVPPLLLQPLVENALEHGAAPYNVKVTVTRTENHLHIVVVNAVQATDERKEHRHRSRASDILQDRLALLDRLYNSTSTFYAERSDTEYTVRIVLPILEAQES